MLVRHLLDMDCRYISQVQSSWEGQKPWSLLPSRNPSTARSPGQGRSSPSQWRIALKKGDHVRSWRHQSTKKEPKNGQDGKRIPEIAILCLPNAFRWPYSFAEFGRRLGGLQRPASMRLALTAPIRGVGAKRRWV